MHGREWGGGWEVWELVSWLVDSSFLFFFSFSFFFFLFRGRPIVGVLLPKFVRVEERSRAPSGRKVLDVSTPVSCHVRGLHKLRLYGWAANMELL